LALMDFGVTEVPATKSKRILKLQELLLELRLEGKAPVLIVDEAHTLSPETLEEIRLLTNFETTEEKLLQIVLAGQNDLAAILNRSDLRQLKQRIEVRMDLRPLVDSEVGPYMQHRWIRAGGSTTLPFAHAATALIAKGSRGIPRLVNSICDNALLLAYANDEPLIGAGHIQHVLRDLDLCGPQPMRTNLNNRSLPEEGNDRRSPTNRPFLEVEDDGSPSLKATLAMRFADRMNAGPARSRRDKS
jgi:general secretion pathway protein A